VAALRAIGPVGGSVAFHVLLIALVSGLAVRRAAAPQEALQVAVIDVPSPRPVKAPVKPPVKIEEQKPMPPRPLRLTRAKKIQEPPIRSSLPPPPPSSAPPPPTEEAKTETPPVVLPGISYESTTRSGGMAVATGNTLYGDPGRTGRDPATVKPYKAARYAPAAQITEMPQPHCDKNILQKYYPEEARRHDFEGDVTFRLLIDSDGSVAKAELIRDPGQGLGAAGLRAIRECPFSPAKVNGEPVATSVPFTLHFQLN
jgi:TonB family protein